MGLKKSEWTKGSEEKVIEIYYIQHRYFLAEP